MNAFVDRILFAIGSKELAMGNGAISAFNEFLAALAATDWTATAKLLAARVSVNGTDVSGRREANMSSG